MLGVLESKMRAYVESGCKDTTNPQGCCGLTLVIVGQSPTKQEKVGRGGEGKRKQHRVRVLRVRLQMRKKGR